MRSDTCTVKCEKYLLLTCGSDLIIHRCLALYTSEDEHIPHHSSTRGSSTDIQLQAQIFKMILALLRVVVCDAEHPLLPIIMYLLAKVQTFNCYRKIISQLYASSCTFLTCYFFSQIFSCTHTGTNLPELNLLFFVFKI